MENKTFLFLTIKKEFFDQILGGEKTSEFREYKKHWIQKLMYSHNDFKSYDVVLFQNGYKKNAPRIWVEFKGVKIIQIKSGFATWENLFEIELGKIIKTENV